MLRKAYGGAYIVMDCRTMGSDLYLAWPSAEIAVMGAKGAVEILHRRADARGAARPLEADYEERFLNPYVAADRGLVDAVIDPADTRREVAAALELLADQAGVASSAAKARQHALCRGRYPRRTWPRASRSPTTAPASRSRCRSSTAASTPPSGASSSRGSGSTTRR